MVEALEFHGKINFMKGGLVFADRLGTVSARYREEILTPHYGFGLEGIFQERAADLFGLREGLDRKSSRRPGPGTGSLVAPKARAAMARLDYARQSAIS